MAGSVIGNQAFLNQMLFIMHDTEAGILDYTGKEGENNQTIARLSSELAHMAANAAGRDAIYTMDDVKSLQKELEEYKALKDQYSSEKKNLNTIHSCASTAYESWKGLLGENAKEGFSIFG